MKGTFSFPSNTDKHQDKRGNRKNAERKNATHIKELVV
jgi:hypothetical protein